MLGIPDSDHGVHFLDQLLFLVIIKLHVPFGQSRLPRSVLNKDEANLENITSNKKGRHDSKIADMGSDKSLSWRRRYKNIFFFFFEDENRKKQKAILLDRQRYRRKFWQLAAGMYVFVQVCIQQDYLAILVTLCRLTAKWTSVALALANVYVKHELNHTHLFWHHNGEPMTMSKLLLYPGFVIWLSAV